MRDSLLHGNKPKNEGSEKKGSSRHVLVELNVSVLWFVAPSRRSVVVAVPVKLYTYLAVYLVQVSAMASLNDLELRIERGLNEITIVLQGVHSSTPLLALEADPCEWHRQVFDIWRRILQVRVRNSEVLYRVLGMQLFRCVSSRGNGFTAFEKDFILFWMKENSARAPRCGTHVNNLQATCCGNVAPPRSGTVVAPRGGTIVWYLEYLHQMKFPNRATNLIEKWRLVLKYRLKFQLAPSMRTHWSVRFMTRFGCVICCRYT